MPLYIDCSWPARSPGRCPKVARPAKYFGIIKFGPNKKYFRERVHKVMASQIVTCVRLFQIAHVHIEAKLETLNNSMIS